MLLAWPLVSHSSSRADGEAPQAAHVVGSVLQASIWWGLHGFLSQPSPPSTG